MRDLSYLKGKIGNLKKKMGRRFGIERVHGMRDAENSRRDYGIAPKFVSV